MNSNIKPHYFCLFCVLIFTQFSCNSKKKTNVKKSYSFELDNLIPWSIVAFDVKERTPLERVEMVKKLGFSQYAFGGREQHIATLEEEISIAKKEHIKISAVWLYINHSKDAPGELKPMSEQVFQALENTDLETQIWVGFSPDYYKGLSNEQSLETTKEMISFLCERAKKVNCKIALYNHGGWPGEPENQLQIIKALPQYEIGMIYNFHHGHEQLERYPQIIEEISPYLWCVSLNGMKKEGPKIISIGKGNLEKEMIQLLLDKGYQGPWGILGHVKGGDPEVILKENLKGLQTLFPNNN